MKNNKNFESPDGVKWNYEPALARVVSVVVADVPEHKYYWARPYVGLRRQAVEVRQDRQVIYLDNADGSGVFKVTNGGHWKLPHKSISVQPGTDILELRPDQVVYPTPNLSDQVQSEIERDCIALFGPEYAEMIADNRKRLEEYRRSQNG